MLTTMDNNHRYTTCSCLQDIGEASSSEMPSDRLLGEGSSAAGETHVFGQQQPPGQGRTQRMYSTLSNPNPDTEDMLP